MLRLDGCEMGAGNFRLRADFTLPRGARCAVIGPSGAGKSTLLEAIAGFSTLRRGAIAFEGEPIHGRAPGDRPVATLFQDGNLFAHKTAAQNVGLGLAPNRQLTDADRDQVEAALARVGLAGLGGRKPAALSGGQQSRAALARVLVQRRSILLLDEPFAALGPALKTEMLDLVQALVAETGQTLLMVTHDPEDAKRIATHAAFIDGGEVQPPQEIGAFFGKPSAGLSAYLGQGR